MGLGSLNLFFITFLEIIANRMHVIAPAAPKFTVNAIHVIQAPIEVHTSQP